MPTRVYDVPSISCGHCKSAIEGAVSTVDGVDNVLVDIDARTVTVDGAASDDAVERAITEDAGYEIAARSEG